MHLLTSECVWQKEINQRMNNNVETSKAMEKLFTFSSANVK